MSSRPTPGSALTPAAPDRRQARDGATITPIGVDMGVKQLAVAATPGEGGDVLVAGAGEYVPKLYAEFCSATHRLAVAPDYDDTSIGDLVSRYWPRLEATFANVAEEVLAYAHQHPAPVLVLEDFESERRPLRACACGNWRLSLWCPPVSQAILVDRAVDAGVPVTYVNPEYTSQECHRCGSIGDLERETLSCTNDDCPVDEVCRDRSAAMTIAQRGLEEL